jgi:hypothetical protein
VRGEAKFNQCVFVRLRELEEVPAHQGGEP